MLKKINLVFKYLTISEFQEICENIFEKYFSEGLLYSLAFALEENNMPINRVLELTNKWLRNNPNNNQLLRLKDYIINKNSQFQ